jgi:hypothetical protein
MMKGYKDVEAAKGYVKDMELSQEKAQLKSQEKEFKAYLENKVKNTPEQFVKFFRDMLGYMNDGMILTPGMVAALQKAQDRDKAYEDKKNSKAEAQPERTITLKVRAWLMKDLEIDSRIITGTVKVETAKAYLIAGHADMIYNACWCMRCGKELTEPASQVTGFGAICADRLGIPYDKEGVLTASKAVRKSIRSQYVEKLQNQRFERWIPKSQVEETMPDGTKLESVSKKKNPAKK